jgi:integrase
MAKKVEVMAAVDVSRCVTPGFHNVGGVAGLYLQVFESGARSWILRIKVGTKRRDMGLGGFPDVSLADARKKAKEMREVVSDGGDPIENRRAARSARLASQAAAVSFKFCALAYIDAHEAGWRNTKHAQQWRNTLETYAYPVMGDVLVRDVALPQVMSILEPIWKTKTETASRLRGRIESVLDWATSSGYREGLNPARWKGHFDTLLAKPGKVAKAVHHPALSLGEMGDFMQALRQREGMGARALEFSILTAARSGETRGATWEEIDMDAALWIIPGNRMKAGAEHRVPLSEPALAVLKAVPRMAGTDLVFSAPRGGMLSDMSLTAVTRRMDAACVPHGFRSTFRDWCAERTNYPRDLAEMALAHAIGDKVEAAYRRGDMLEKRRRMMVEWAAFCAKPEPKKGEVIPMHKAASM